MKILNNPIRLLQHNELASFPSPSSFYRGFLKCIHDCFPRGYVDIYYFFETYTPFRDAVLLNFWREMKELISKQPPKWFIDPYTIRIDWSNMDETYTKLNWLIESLIMVVNRFVPPMFEGILFSQFYEDFYKSI